MIKAVPLQEFGILAVLPRVGAGPTQAGQIKCGGVLTPHHPREVRGGEKQFAVEVSHRL